MLDGGVIVFDGVAGVEPQSETVWRQADKYDIPRICFINKMDRMGADFYISLKSISERLTTKAVPIQLPIGAHDSFKGVIDLMTERAYLYQDDMGKDILETDIPEDMKEEVYKYKRKMIEAIAETEDALLEKFLVDQVLTVDELKKALRSAVIKGKLYPVLSGAALRNKGVQPLLDAIVDYLPNPLEVPPVNGIDSKTDEEITRHADDSEPFSALAFKIATDPFIGKLIYIRVYSGTLKSGSYVLNTATGTQERIGRIVRMHSNHREEVDEIYAGDIAAVVGIKKVTTGNTLCDIQHPIILESIVFPEPVISIAIEPKSKADQERMSIALGKLAEEDPTFRVKTNEETSQTELSGMGELHLDIIVDRLKREFKVEANIGKPQVAYHETIRKPSDVEAKYIKQSGGRGQYGHVLMKLEPFNEEGGFEFVNKIVSGRIPKEYIPAVEKGVKEAMTRGVLAGYPVVGIRAILYDGSYHEVDSSEMAFKIAGSMALQDGVKKGDPVLLEPIMKIEAVTPEEFMGDVTGDLNSRRAIIEALGQRGTARTVSALVPLAQMFGYATDLRSMTQGRASYTMEFSKYAEVPTNVQQEIIGKRQT